jgi:hypothetical protein
MEGEGRRRSPLEQIYGRLGDHLSSRAAGGEVRVTLTFAAMEGAILGRPFPASARSPQVYQRWWGTGGSFPHRWYGWQRAGWAVEVVDLGAETVTFVRTGGTPAT